MDVGNFKSVDDKDEAVLLVQRASEAITARKAHQLRSINQDRARLVVLASRDSTGDLIVQDFVMKFMPVQYREAQSDFFGKRGLSWHVSVCDRKVGGKPESQTFIHILQTGHCGCLNHGPCASVVKEAAPGDCPFVFPARQRQMLPFSTNHTVSGYHVRKEWNPSQ